MQTRLQDSIANHLLNKGIRQDERIYNYIFSIMALGCCVAVHFYFLVAFAYFRASMQLALNTFSLLVYGALIVMLRKGRFDSISLVLSAEVALYATITTFDTNLSTYAVGYYLMAALFQIILPHKQHKIRCGLLIAIAAVSVVAVALCVNRPVNPAYPVHLINFLTVSNIYILFIGTLAQLYVDGMVKRIIARLNEIKMEQLSVLAYTDSLTGLFNRHYAEYFFGKMLVHDGLNRCVAMLDIDDFKVVNDTWGHECGDEVLKFLADFLRSSLRKTDVIFRWGGEEFLLVMVGVDLSIAHDILDKLRTRLQHTPIPYDGREFYITATIGIAPLIPGKIDESILQSDRKLYIGKQGKKNVVVS